MPDPENREVGPTPFLLTEELANSPDFVGDFAGTLDIKGVLGSYFHADPASAPKAEEITDKLMGEFSAGITTMAQKPDGEIDLDLIRSAFDRVTNEMNVVASEKFGYDYGIGQAVLHKMGIKKPEPKQYVDSPTDKYWDEEFLRQYEDEEIVQRQEGETDQQYLTRHVHSSMYGYLFGPFKFAKSIRDKTEHKRHGFKNPNSFRMLKTAARFSILTPIVAGALAGGYLGYKAPLWDEESANRDDLELAGGYKRCLKLVQAGQPQGVVIRLGSLSSEQQSDCGLGNVEKNINSFYEGEGWYDDPLGAAGELGAEIVKKPSANPLIRLPSPESIQEAIDKQKKEAEFSTYATVGSIGLAPLGLLTGGAVGLLLVGGTLIAADRIKRLRWRKQAGQEEV